MALPASHQQSPEVGRRNRLHADESQRLILVCILEPTGFGSCRVEAKNRVQRNYAAVQLDCETFSAGVVL